MTKKETEQKIDKTSYTLDSINTEDARTAVRRHPSKELGSARRNTNLISEIYANSVDEHVIGHGNQIDVIVDTVKNEYTVTDYGQGFLVNAGIDKNGKTILQRSFDTMNTSGKSKDGNVYQGSSLGTNGIGAKLANWLSKSLHVITYRDGEFEELWFKDGLFDKRKVGKTKRPSGTTVTWYPDAKFFSDNTPDIDELKEHFETICALCPDLTTNFTYNGKCISYHEPDGLNGYVSKHIKTEIFDKRFLMKRELGPYKLDICITYTDSYDEHLQAYVNLGATDAGVHITAFHQALSKAINKYAQAHNLLKAKEKSISMSEISEGLFVVFNYTANKVDYGAQVKTKVDYVDTTLITNTISGDFGTWLEENPSQANTIVDRALLARKAREASRKAKEAIRSTAKNSKSLFANLPTKLSDCYPKNKSDRSLCELYIVEGDSAASSILATRDSTFIAVYPIRGKILNCQGATMDKILANQEISGLVKALGLDTDKTTGKSIYDEKKLRYNKIVIVTDQDEDGFAISNLIFTVIDWLCPELVTKGHLFRIYSSLFSVIMKDGTIHNFSSKADFESWKSKNKKAQYEVSRIKGLGEMDKEMAYAQLTNPATRDLRQFTVKNYTEFCQYLEDFEGTSVDNRRDYLEEHFNDYTE